MGSTYRSVAGFGEAFEFALHRIVGYAPFGGSAIGEVLRATATVVDGDLDSWSAAWEDVGTAVARTADDALTAARPVTARHAFLRAHNYLRAAAISRVHTDPGHRRAWDESVRCFAAAGELREPAAQRIEIPYEHTTLPGWFLPAADDGAARPTLIAMGGGDASGEESYFHCGGENAAERGWNLLVFHGPGHRGALHRDPALRWRADYEVVLSQVVDFALARADVDPARVALYGVSLGGYAVLRAAGTDPRIAAVIPNSAVLDFHEAASTPPPPGTPPPAPPSPSTIRAALDLYRWTYDPGIDSRADFLERIRDFRSTEQVAGIRCPVLSISSDGEPPSTHPQVERFAKLCPAPLTSRHFTADEGADGHVQFTNLPLVTDTIFDWLDDVLGR